MQVISPLIPWRQDPLLVIFSGAFWSKGVCYLPPALPGFEPRCPRKTFSSSLNAPLKPSYLDQAKTWTSRSYDERTLMAKLQGKIVDLFYITLGKRQIRVHAGRLNDNIIINGKLIKQTLHGMSCMLAFEYVSNTSTEHGVNTCNVNVMIMWRHKR